jgi:hypothetical protein
MQIYSVSITEKPKSGELVLVEAGFAVFAKPDFAGDDSLPAGSVTISAY